MPIVNKSSMLKNKIEIEELFKKGASFSKGVIKIVFFKNKPKTLKVGFSVPKKLIPLAVTRNLIKRRMKESFRALNVSVFLDKPGSFFVVYRSNKTVSFKEINSCMSFLVLKGFH